MRHWRTNPWIPVALLLAALLLSPYPPKDSVAGEFEQFKQSQQHGTEHISEEFHTYSDKIDAQFKTFKDIVDEEYKKHKKQLLEYWHVPKITGKKQWIEYTPDFKKRKIVDFENETIELDLIITRKNDDIEKAFNRLLTDLILEDKQTAFERDTISQNIEKRLNKTVKQAKSGSVDKTPILTKAITGSSDPSRQVVEKTVLELRKKGQIERKPSKVKGAEVLTLKIPLPSTFMQKKAREYKPDVSYFAKERNIDEALLLAVIHTESAFNPMARSHIPAYGLMQIVPQSAGIDASEVVFGKKKLLSPSYLYNGNNNINIGTTYIYIVFYRYLKNISNLESRLYCTIASYNTGVGNVARAFTGTKSISKANDVINGMSPKQVYDTLLRKLPYKETKNYLRKVSERLAMYRSM